MSNTKVITQLLKRFKVLEEQSKIEADVNSSGLVPAREANALVSGILGPKGRRNLPSTNLDEVDEGGIWLIANDGSSYQNVPFSSAFYPANLWVVRNFGTYPRTDKPALTQIFTGTTQAKSVVAYRTKLYDGWGPWKYPLGKVLFEGKSAVGSDVIIDGSNANYDFLDLEIFFNGRKVHKRVNAISEFEIPLITTANDVSKICNLKCKFQGGNVFKNDFLGIQISTSGSILGNITPAETYITKIVGYSGIV